MERLVRVAKKLRKEHNFNGYIHLKTIPGASNELMHEAGLYADRLSINIEIPTESGLKLLAPDKNRKDMLAPMGFVQSEIIRLKEEKKVIRHTPLYAPAGQSTQMVIGAANETDRDIMQIAGGLYKRFGLKRVYYSGYVPISNDSRLPVLGTRVPVLRENRLYQTDWLLRFYGFEVNELLNQDTPWLDMDIDPKLSWALRNMHHFPVDVNRADKYMLLRVPGMGLKSVTKIISARAFSPLTWEHLAKLGVAINRAKYFLVCGSRVQSHREYDPIKIRQFILADTTSKFQVRQTNQLLLFG
jgi:putative DNA modification/repair radical SAM protein